MTSTTALLSIMPAALLSYNSTLPAIVSCADEDEPAGVWQAMPATSQHPAITTKNVRISLVIKHDLIYPRPQLTRHIDLIGTRIVRYPVQNIAPGIPVFFLLGQ